MMLIRCPWCGERAHTEFTYGGDGTERRPDGAGPGQEAAWHAFVYLRDNPRGAHRELWHHSHGCRQWIVVERDTQTHEIAATRKLGSASDGPGGE